jgi:hypothetical protein
MVVGKIKSNVYGHLHRDEIRLAYFVGKGRTLFTWLEGEMIYECTRNYVDFKRA